MLFRSDRIQLCFPKEFFICALDEAESAIYKNDENDVNAIFSVVKKETRTLKMPDLKKQIIQNMKSMDLYTEWIEDGALDIEGNAIPFCLFSNPVANGKVFNLMFFISLGKNNLIVNINGNANDLWLWEPIGKGMLQTLEINQK